MKKTKILIIVAIGAAVVALLAVVFLLLPKLQDSKDAGGGIKVEETKGVLGEPLDVTLDFYEKWRSAKASTTTDPYAEGLATSSVLDKALSKKNTDNETAFRNEQKDMVICDTSVAQDVKAKVIFSNDTKAQVLIFPKDKDTRGIQVMVTLSGDGGYWKITDIQCGAGEQDLNPGEFSFDNVGYLLKQSVPAPMDPQYWHLVFEQSGELGHTTPLIFSSSSICVLDDGLQKVCTQETFFEAMKIHVQGNMTEGGLDVSRIEVIKQ